VMKKGLGCRVGKLLVLGRRVNVVVWWMCGRIGRMRGYR
jgi:hypothetical protein